MEYLHRRIDVTCWSHVAGTEDGLSIMFIQTSLWLKRSDERDFRGQDAIPRRCGAQLHCMAGRE